MGNQLEKYLTESKNSMSIFGVKSGGVGIKLY